MKTYEIKDEIWAKNFQECMKGDQKFHDYQNNSFGKDLGTLDQLTWAKNCLMDAGIKIKKEDLEIKSSCTIQ